MWFRGYIAYDFWLVSIQDQPRHILHVVQNRPLDAWTIDQWFEIDRIVNLYYPLKTDTGPYAEIVNFYLLCFSTDQSEWLSIISIVDVAVYLSKLNVIFRWSSCASRCEYIVASQERSASSTNRLDKIGNGVCARLMHTWAISLDEFDSISILSSTSLYPAGNIIHTAVVVALVPFTI